MDQITEIKDVPLGLLNTTYSSKDEVRKIVQEAAKAMGFAAATKRSNNRNVYMQCVHGGELKNCHGVTEETRIRECSTQRRSCPWELYATYSKKKAVWIIRRVMDASVHNHLLDSHAATSYHQHRTITAEISRRIVTMTNNAIRPAKILEDLIDNDDGIIITIKDIYNFRQKIFEDDRSGGFSKLFEFLVNNGYTVRYRINSTSNVLEALFVTHQIGLEAGRKFKEVISLDATYGTNNNKMPLINIVGVSNLGTDKLRNILVASAVVINERTESYQWVMQTMRSTIWPKGDVGLFITDNERALINAIEYTFPDSRHILCGWHIAQHLRSKFSGCFPKKSENYAEIKRIVNAMIFTCHDEEKFEAAVEQYRAIARRVSTSSSSFKSAKNAKEKSDKGCKKVTRGTPIEMDGAFKNNQIQSTRATKIIDYMQRYIHI